MFNFVICNTLRGNIIIIYWYAVAATQGQHENQKKAYIKVQGRYTWQFPVDRKSIQSHRISEKEMPISN